MAEETKETKKIIPESKKKHKKKHKKKWYVRLRCGKKTGKKWHYSAYSKTYKVK